VKRRWRGLRLGRTTELPGVTTKRPRVQKTGGIELFVAAEVQESRQTLVVS
jgi:hypothetical protein